MAGSTSLLAPIEASKRLASIDILRGFAVLGILLVTIQGYALPQSTSINPTSFENPGGYDLWVWLVSHVFAEGKFMNIFAMLFGASMIMISNKAKKEHLRSGDLQSRRLVWLLIIGLAHAYLLWYGDVLVALAICGFFMFVFRSRKSKALFRAGIVFISIGFAISLVLGYSVPFWEPGQFESLETEIWTPTKAMLDSESDYYTSNWERQMIHRAPQAFRSQTIVFITSTFWQISGMMLIGMAFYKKRVFTTKQSRKYYRKLAVYGMGIGLPLVVVSLMLHYNFDWSFRVSYYYISQINYLGSIAMAIGYTGIIMSLVKISTNSALAKRLAKVGRMSLSNYLIQTIICTYIFYGHGLGLFADLDRSGLAFIVLGIWAFQVVFSSVWLSQFRYGPFEWLWRSLTYGKIQPMAKSAG